MLQDLTLVIPTYFRQDYALRLMTYWSGKGPRLVVIDGTDKPIPEKEIEWLGNSIQYVHNPVGFYQRLRVALDLVTTKYVALAGDDEFYIPTAVMSCIVELERDPALVACCGRSLGFRVVGEDIFGSPQYPALKDYVLLDEDPRQRLSFHMENYVPSLIYAICTTEAWKAAFLVKTKTEFPVFAIGELQVEMILSFAGKSKVIPELMWMRSHGETEPTRGRDPSLDPNKRFEVWWTSTSKAEERELFLRMMGDAYRQLHADKYADYRAVAVSGCEAYMRFLHSRKSFAVRRIAAEILPKSIKEYLLDILSNHKNKHSNFLTLSQAAKDLQTEGVAIDFSALAEIELTIKEFHRSRLRPPTQFA